MKTTWGKEKRKVKGRKLERRPSWIKKRLGDIDKWMYRKGILSAKNLTLPDFMCIGAQKAGSTWLHRNLKCHPEVLMTRKKELHYFSFFFHESLRSYSREFKGGKGKAVLKGELTPAYGVLPIDRIEFIRMVMPEVKLIFLMRNPMERAWSHTLMDLVRYYQWTYEEITDEEFHSHFQSTNSLKKGDYETILDNWLSIFPREQMYIGYYEDMKDKPKELLKEVFAFLGISTDVDWKGFPYNEKFHTGPDIPIPEKHREFLAELYRDKIESLYKRFGPRVKTWRC